MLLHYYWYVFGDESGKVLGIRAIAGKSCQVSVSRPTPIDMALTPTKKDGAGGSAEYRGSAEYQSDFVCKRGEKWSK